VLGFPAVLYYYRRAYYRAFWRSPGACAVREPHAKYTGETRFPLIMQNLHRYFFYAVILISILNTYDAVEAFHPEKGGFGFGLGFADHGGQRGAAVGVLAELPHLPAHSPAGG